jgi:periplasmic protein TonB
VFRTTEPPDENRREPTLTGAPRLVPPDPLQIEPPESRAPVKARERVHWRGPIASLVVHLLPLLLLVEWPMAAPPEETPIAVQLVMEPPPPPPVPPPQPVPPKPEFKPPPPGRIASEDIGDTETKEAGGAANAATTAKNEPAPPEPPPAESPQQTAAVVPPPPPMKPEPPKPQSKPAAQQQARRTEEPAPSTHRAKYPGPAATRDDYLAYVHSLIRQHYNMLPLSMVGTRRGETRVEFLVLGDGTIAMVRVRQSSGYPDIDARVELMIAAVRRVPPLPQWFQGPSMALILDLPFPDALRE